MNKLIYPVKKINAKLHLKFKCPKCHEQRKLKRDVLNQGECFWYENWKNGNYNIKSHRSYRIFKKLGIKRSLIL